MRLNKTMKAAFVNAAMADVPNIDYQEMTINLVKVEIDKSLPFEVASIYANEALRKYIKTAWYSFGCAHMLTPLHRNDLSTAAQNKIDALKVEYDKQNQVRHDLRTKLIGVTEACTTRKALLEALPEFEKYLPETEAAANRQLPALTNVLSDFVKAGWPKNQKKISKTTI